MIKFKPLLAIVALLSCGILVADHMKPKTIDKRTAPVGKVKVDKAAPAAASTAAPAAAPGTRTGKAIVETYCIACHGTNMPNAPQIGDKAGWAVKLEPGMDATLAIAKSGKNVMPPMGTCADCTDEELIKAIEFMANFEK